MKAIIILLTFLLTSFISRIGFLADQMKFERVRTSVKEKGSIVASNLKQNDLLPENVNIIIVAYKDEDILEIYAKNTSSSAYKKIKTYDICSRSGQLGPKRNSGDGQVPEGFYSIERFNPTSKFYLSLGLNYPNQSDKIKCTSTDPGGDIFIHGNCVTIGCLPMTNDKIKEIYLYSVYAMNNGQNKIPVYIFPFKMTKQKMDLYKSKFHSYPALVSFWHNLAIGYDYFQKHKRELSFSVDKKGDYLIENN